jgi:DNA-binding beta-propeller fold protein YncE
VTAAREAGPGSARGRAGTAALDPAVLPESVTAAGVEGGNGSFGSVAFTWVLENGTVAPGAVNQPYGVGPDQVLYISANETLWTAFATPPTGQSYNITVRNVTNNATFVVNGLGNVTSWVDDPATSEVYLTETFPGTGTGGVLALLAPGGDIVRAPTLVGVDPMGIAVDPATGNLWATVASASNSSGNVTIVSASTESVLGVVRVGVDPTSVAFDGPLGVGFVANSGSDNLTALNSTTGRETGSSVVLPGSPVPGTLAVDPVTGDLFVVVTVGVARSTELVAVDPESGTVLATDPVPGSGNATSLLVNPTSGEAFVTTDGPTANAGTLERWDPVTATWSLAARLPGRPVAQTLDRGSDIDYVGQAGQVFVSAVNLSSNGPPATVAFGAGPRSGTYDSSNGKVYVVNSYAGTGGAGSGPDVLDALVPTTGTAAEVVSPGPSDVSPVGAGLVGVSYDPTTDRLFTADESWSEGTVLGGESGAWMGNLSLPFAPVAVADDPVRSIVYFASNTGGIAGFDAGNLTPTGPWNMTPPAVPWTGPSESLAVDPETGDVLFLEPDLAPSAVSVLWILDPANGTTQFVPLGGPGAAHAGDVPVGVAFDPADGDAYVAEKGGTLLAVNVTNGTTVAQVALGGSPSFVAVDSARSAILVTEATAATVAVLNGSTPSGLSGPVLSLGTGPDPTGVTVDPRVDQPVVSDYGSGTLDAYSAVPEVAGLVPYGTAPALGGTGAPIGTDDLGIPVVFHTVAGGGTPPLDFVYSGLPSGCSTADVALLACRPTLPGTSVVQVGVTDRSGASANASALLTVVPAPSVTLTATPDRVDAVGRAVAILANVTGGIPPYDYAFDFGDGAAPVNGTLRSGGVTQSHAYEAVGRYSATVSVVDAFGITASATVGVEVGLPMAGTLTAHATPGTTPTVGSPLSLSAAVTGGLEPYSFAWKLPNRSAFTVPSSAVNASTVTVTPYAAGAETVQVWVNDSGGSSVVLSVNFTVASAPSSGGAGPDAAEWLAGAGVVLVAAAVVAVLVWRRRSARPPG